MSSRQRNLIHDIEGTPLYLRCPNCSSWKHKPASKSKVTESLGKYIIDIFTNKWLECSECGSTWRTPDKKEENIDEDREGNREDSSL